MKILYVGDGRCRHNWGARATSKALRDILAKNHEITDILESDVKDAAYCKVLFHPAVPQKIVNYFVLRKSKVIQGSVLKILNRIIRFQTDYIVEDTATSLSNFHKLRKYYPQLQDIYEKVKKSEAVVLNGEGTFIFTTPPRRAALFFLFILQLAQSLEKKTYCLNNMISDCPVNGRNNTTVKELVKVFRKTDLITLRDTLSLNLLKEISPDINCRYVPDALFSWKKYYEKNLAYPTVGDFVVPWPERDIYFQDFDFSKPYICISGSSLAAWDQEKAVDGYMMLVNKLKEIGLPLYIVPTCNGDRFLSKVSLQTGVPIIPLLTPIVMGSSILANARVFVSGRFHPSIMASNGGTPCVFLGSNSHKTISIQHVLKYDTPIEYSAIPNANEIEKIFAHVQDFLLKGEGLRSKIITVVNELSSQAEKSVTIL